MPDVKQAQARAKAAVKEGKAIEGIRALRAQLAEDNPAYAVAVDLENEAERFSREVRNTLREQRKAQKLDQSELAARLDMTQSAVSKIESGDGDLGVKTVFRYAHALGLIPVCLLLPDSSQLFPKSAAAAAKAAQHLQTDFVKETSNAMSSAVAGLARAFNRDNA
jgi:transcriptional regulator with XRE-family HTH domain